jgi:hypothetical protein
VGVIVSGGNVDADMLVRALADPSTGVAGAGR